ncbi:acetyl-CoA carboxylase biotin carboxyl carrier protein [Bradyrhizobium sp. 61]|uniref:acetyl-CoA carboxylase biotin carboxyl carrier protein n=1 Tax=Bradyrhizobium sp. 61 TaxID=2782679 RepID=UPI001FFBBF1D|nr:biotin/lipoyl-containing protein [Bradyrhizobium sp. 61]MCK1281077.1 acetyl-CoA carboxylase biotin carboxyl carrier protein [Bradyrhizobium sp. 61]
MTVPSISFLEGVIDLFNRSGATEFEFRDGDVSVKLRRDASAGLAIVSPAASTSAPAPSNALTGAPLATTKAEEVVPAFMHGVFHRAPAPSEKPFVEIGAKVTKDQQIGILEAMKVFMPVVSPIDGTIVQIHVENAADVSVGQALMTVGLSRTGERV